MPLGYGDQNLFPTEEAGGIFPGPSTKKSALYDSKRAGLAPGPWKHLALATLLFQRTEVLQRRIFSGNFNQNKGETFSAPDPQSAIPFFAVEIKKKGGL
jgi:hypothetical protein